MPLHLNIFIIGVNLYQTFKTKNMETWKNYKTLLTLPLFLIFFFISCQQTKKDETMDAGELEAQESARVGEVPIFHDFATPIERAHGIGSWQSKDVLSAKIEVKFGENTALNGEMIMETTGGKRRLELEDGTIAVFDGEHAWVSPDTSAMEMARFHLLTWPYFLAAPMKLQDPGTKLEDKGKLPLGDKEYPAAKLTFENGTGDTPDDWYVLYRDPDNDRLHAMGYIVTYGKGKEKASEEPHAIVYNDYKEVEGVQIPTLWNFYMWSEEEGISDEKIAEVALKDPKFVEVPENAFTKPAGAVEAKLPKAGKSN